MQQNIKCNKEINLIEPSQNKRKENFLFLDYLKKK